MSDSVYNQIPLRDGFPTFSAAEIDRRQAALRRMLAEQGLAAALLYGAGRFHSDLQYMTNWPGGREGFFILPLDREPTLLVQLHNHVHMAGRLSLVPDTRWAGADSLTTVAATLREAGASRGRVGLIGGLAYTAFARLQALLPEVQFVDLAPAFRDLRQIKSAEELQFFRIACELTDRSLDRLAATLRPGLREYELAAVVEAAPLEAGGYAGIHFMASTPMHDPNVFVPHQYQSDRVLQPGDALITEISGGFWGYTGQIHRTFCLGEPAPEWVQIHAAAEATFAAVAAVLKDGATAEQVLDAAEGIHGYGYTICDDLLHGANQYPPILRTRSTDHGYPAGLVFREQMVVTIQPQPTTRDRRLGLQYGETVLIARNGVERLHRYPRKLVVIDA